MGMAKELLNIYENKIGHKLHKGVLVFKAADVCDLAGIPDENDVMWMLKDNDKIVLLDRAGNDSLYITESGVYTLIQIGKSQWAEEARDSLCE